MSPTFTRDEMRTLLRSRDIPESMIARIIAREFGDQTPAAEAPTAAVTREIEWPIKITLPWSALVSDNDKYSAVIRRNGSAKEFPKLVLTARYKDAKEKAREVAKRMMAGVEPVSDALAFTARVYVPDNRPGHDVCNFAKCCLDAFEGAIYRNDGQLHRVVWERAGVDVDAPRAEIEVRPL